MNAFAVPAPLAVALAAFAYGLVGSLHCAAMCGPLCCAFLSPRGGDGLAPATGARREALRAALAYSATRVLAYAALGAVAGGLGQGASQVTGALSSRAALLVFAALLGGMALPWGWIGPRLLARLPIPARPYGRLADLLLGLPRSARGAFLGLATPMLPCGFLYGALAGALSSGNLAAGLVTMLAFAMGTVPMLVLLVVGAGELAQRVSSRGARLLQQAIAVLAAAGLLYSAWTMPAERAPGAPATCAHCAPSPP